jgi:hypothetical protein
MSGHSSRTTSRFGAGDADRVRTKRRPRSGSSGG